MIGFIIAAIISVVLIAAFIAWQTCLTNKYGIPELPDDIQRLDSRIENEPVRLDVSGFTFEKAQFGRKVFSRSYDKQDGRWLLTVEMAGDTVAAYRAVFKHDKSWWLGCMREKAGKTIPPKIILPGE
jgi:hypothetical protein